jgi:hypothetical protein
MEYVRSTEYTQRSRVFSQIAHLDTIPLSGTPEYIG